MKRTDIHSESNLIPSDYEDVGYWDANPGYPLTEWELKERRWFVDLVINNKSSIHGLGQCAHCGSYIRHHVLFKHIPTDTYLVVGNTCAEKRFGFDDAEYDAYRNSLSNRRKEAALIGKLELWKKSDSRNEDAYNFIIGEVAANLMMKHNGSANFLYSLHEQLLSKKYLSEKQVEALLKIKFENEKYISRIAENDSKLSDVIEGSGITLNGIIKKVKFVPGYTVNSLPTVKMTVLDSRNFMVFGSCPTSIVKEVCGYNAYDNEDIEPLVGKELSFVANVTQSSDRPVFGFFKRPRKATLSKTA